jgi:hypothetical protein
LNVIYDENFFQSSSVLLTASYIESYVEKPCLLCKEPFSKLFISAVSKTTNEVRNVVIKLKLSLVLRRQSRGNVFLVNFRFNCDSMLAGH